MRERDEAAVRRLMQSLLHGDAGGDAMSAWEDLLDSIIETVTERVLQRLQRDAASAGAVIAADVERRLASVLPPPTRIHPNVALGDEVAERVARVASTGVIRPEAAADIAANRQLRCGTCDVRRAISPDEVLDYLSRGWPTCCGATMALETAPLEDSPPPPGSDGSCARCGETYRYEEDVDGAEIRVCDCGP